MSMTHLFFGFSGRINRQLFILGTFFLGFLNGGLLFWIIYESGMKIDKGIPKDLLAIDTIIQGLFLWPFLALAYKRLHDRGKSGKFFGMIYMVRLLLTMPVAFGWISSQAGQNVGYFFLLFVLSVGVIVLCFEMYFLRGTDGDNSYGPDPLRFSSS